MATSPFISGSFRQRKGMQTPPDRPDRVKPVPDEIEGPNFPYRGHETHGVPSDGNPEEYYEDESYEGDGTVSGYAPEPVIEEPVPVRIVAATGRERRAWRATRVTVGEVAQQILGRHDKRLRTIITVHPVLYDGTTSNPDPIYIGDDSGLRPYTGYRIGSDATCDQIMSTEEVWAVADPGKVIEVSIITEFGVEIN